MIIIRIIILVSKLT